MKTLLMFLFFITSLHARRVVEELTFIVEPTHVEKFIEEDRKVWSATLSARAGFLKKEVIQSQKKPSEIKLLIHWRSPVDWAAVAKKLIEETNHRFEKAMGGKDLVIAPFYLVWNDETKEKAASRPWPHNLLRLKIVPSEKRYASLAPRNKKHTEGFRLFKKHCIVCHALNGTGGTMGPELHSPRNATT